VSTHSIAARLLAHRELVQGELAQETITASESGPLNATDITLVDTFKQSAGYSKCGGSDVVNINIAIALDNGASSAYGYSRLTSAEVGFALPSFSRCLFRSHLVGRLCMAHLLEMVFLNTSSLARGKASGLSLDGTGIRYPCMLVTI
jgi:hypothetical protein